MRRSFIVEIGKKEKLLFLIKEVFCLLSRSGQWIIKKVNSGREGNNLLKCFRYGLKYKGAYFSDNLLLRKLFIPITIVRTVGFIYIFLI